MTKLKLTRFQVEAGSRGNNNYFESTSRLTYPWNRERERKVDYSHSSSLSVNGLRGESEISNLDDHPVREEHVARLEVPVYDLLGVYVSYARDHLLHVIARLRLRHLAPVLEHVHQTLQKATRTTISYKTITHTSTSLNVLGAASSIVMEFGDWFSELM